MEEEKIETPTTLQDENEIPSSFKKADWLSAKMIKSPFQSILLGLLLIISTLSTVTIYQYNTNIGIKNTQMEKLEKEVSKQDSLKNVAIQSYQTLLIMNYQRLETQIETMNGLKKEKNIVDSNKNKNNEK